MEFDDLKGVKATQSFRVCPAVNSKFGSVPAVVLYLLRVSFVL